MVDILLAGIKENCYQCKFRKSENEFLFHIMFFKKWKKCLRKLLIQPGTW